MGTVLKASSTGARWCGWGHRPILAPVPVDRWMRCSHRPAPELEPEVELGSVHLLQKQSDWKQGGDVLQGKACCCLKKEQRMFAGEHSPRQPLPPLSHFSCLHFSHHCRPASLHPPSLYLQDALTLWFLPPPNVHAFVSFVYFPLWASFHFCLLRGCFSSNVSHSGSPEVCLSGFVNIWYNVRIKPCGHVRPPHSHRPAYGLFPAGQTPFPRTINPDNKAVYCAINQGDYAEATLSGFAQRAQQSELWVLKNTFRIFLKASAPIVSGMCCINLKQYLGKEKYL